MSDARGSGDVEHSPRRIGGTIGRWLIPCMRSWREPLPLKPKAIDLEYLLLFPTFALIPFERHADPPFGFHCTVSI